MAVGGYQPNVKIKEILCGSSLKPDLSHYVFTVPDVKEIELIVQAPDSQMNGPDGMEESSTTKREVIITKGGEYQLLVGCNIMTCS